MGLTILDEAIAALRAAGFKTHRAYPGAGMPTITQVVAAVQLAEVNFPEKRLSLEAMLLCPQSLGGSACEDAAITAAQALDAIGFQCKVGALSFDGGMGLFCVSCIATVQEQEAEEKEEEEEIVETPEASIYIPFKIGSVVQNWVVSFTASRQVEAPNTQMDESPWRFRLEQFYPTGVQEDGDPQEAPFTLTSGEDKYGNCQWTSYKRTTEIDGIRLIREGTADRRLY